MKSTEKLIKATSKQGAKNRVRLGLAPRSALFFVLCCAVPLLAPFWAAASVQITEVMYDLPGADTGREWVEVTNTGSDPIDLTGYRLTEGGTNHTLTVVAGSVTLSPGQSAIIADNKDKFLIDWPSFSGTLFDSAFSLNNATDTIDVKNKELITLDSVAYDKNGGAAGDGNTFHRVDATLVAGAPNPGSWSGSAPAPVPEPEPEPAPQPPPASTSTPPTSSASSTSQTPPATQASSATTPPPAQTEEKEEDEEKEVAAATPAPIQPTSAKSVVTIEPSTAKAKPNSKVASVSRFDEDQMAAVADQDSAFAGNSLWFYVLGLVALIVLAIAGVLYAQLVTRSRSDSGPTADEFTIQS